MVIVIVSVLVILILILILLLLLELPRSPRAWDFCTPTECSSYQRTMGRLSVAKPIPQITLMITVVIVIVIVIANIQVTVKVIAIAIVIVILELRTPRATAHALARPPTTGHFPPTHHGKPPAGPQNLSHPARKIQESGDAEYHIIL